MSSKEEEYASRNLEMRAEVFEVLKNQGFEDRHADFIAGSMEGDGVHAAVSYRIGLESRFDANELAELTLRTTEGQIIQDYLESLKTVQKSTITLEEIMRMNPKDRVSTVRKLEKEGYNFSSSKQVKKTAPTLADLADMTPQQKINYARNAEKAGKKL